MQPKTVLALIAGLLLGGALTATLTHTPPVDAQVAPVGRFQVATAPPVDDVPFVLRVDTMSGQTWQLVPAWKARDGKAQWRVIPNPQ